MRYTELFRELKCPLENLFKDQGKEEDLKKASSLCIAQIGYMTKKIPSSDLPSKLLVINLLWVYLSLVTMI